MTPLAPLYAQLVGASWIRIAEPIRRLHETRPIVRAHGRFRVVHGSSRIARLIAWTLRLPRSASGADVRLTITRRGDKEAWERSFDGRRFQTRQFRSRHAELGERFGLLEFRYRLHPSDGSLVYEQREAALVLGRLRVRIPATWAPRVEAREDPAASKQVSVKVQVALPGVGPLIAYDGMVVVVEDAPL